MWVTQIISRLLCNMDEMLSTVLPRQRAAQALPAHAEPTADKNSPCLERCALQSLWVFAAEELLDNEEKHFGSPESLTVPFQTIQHKIRDILLTQQHQCLKETVGNVKFMVLWVIGGRFLPPPFSKPLSKTEPLESFWLRPSKAEGSCIPHFPWDLMKYTASGLLSIWSFRLLNQ